LLKKLRLLASVSWRKSLRKYHAQNQRNAVRLPSARGKHPLNSALELVYNARFLFTPALQEAARPDTADYRVIV